MPEIFFGVDDQPLSARERLFEQGVPRCERDAVIATFHYEIDGREHRLHFGESRGMVAEEIGPWEIELCGKGGSGDELGHLNGSFGLAIDEPL